jgi:hypothetical protein
LLRFSSGLPIRTKKPRVSAAAELISRAEIDYFLACARIALHVRCIPFIFCFFSCKQDAGVDWRGRLTNMD